ncbi:MAG: hypothetical protein ABR608_03035 [Pseudonocardiaceae bacterium]
MKPPFVLPADTLPATRDALHRLAEHVLAAARYAATGRIGLVPAKGGFATPPFGPEPTVLAMDIDEFVVTRAGQERRTRIRTVAQAAEFAGIKPGAPEQVYQPATPLELDAPLRIDPVVARLLAEWFELGARALAAFATEVPDDKPTGAQLWPEHFDLAITAARVNYGVSPGDAAIAEPYLYVGPFDGPPANGDVFWNTPFGAALGIHEVISVKRAVEFFHAGRDRLGAAVSPQRQAPPGRRSTR